MNFSNIRSDLATESLEQLEVGKHYQKEEYVMMVLRLKKFRSFRLIKVLIRGLELISK